MDSKSQRQSLLVDTSALRALEDHARLVTKQINAGNAPALSRSLPKRIRSNDLPQDIFKLISMKCRTTSAVCKFFDEPIEKIEPILGALKDADYIEIYKLSPVAAVWRVIESARGRKVSISPPAPPPPPPPSLQVGDWRERRAFLSVRGKGSIEVAVQYPAALDPQFASQDPVAQSPAEPVDRVAEIFQYPMDKMILAAREEWKRRHPASPKAKPPKSGQ